MREQLALLVGEVSDSQYALGALDPPLGPAPAPRRAPRLRRSGRRAPRPPADRARAARADSRPGSRRRARISGSVTVPSSRSVPRALPGPLGRAGHVEHVVEQLEGEPDLPAEGGAAPPHRALPGQAPDAAGGFEETRGLQRAAPQVALLTERGVVGVPALRELPERQRDRRRASSTTSSSPSVSAPARRRRGRRAGRRPPTARSRPDACDHGRPAAPQRRAVEDVVVDQRRHVDQLDGGGGADGPLAAARPAAIRTRDRAQALAAGRRVASASCPRRGP